MRKRALRLAAGLLAAAAPAWATPTFSNFQAHACLGSSLPSTYVSGSGATVYTAAPDLQVTISAAGPSLNANDDGSANPDGPSPIPASLPQISTSVAGLQGAWQFEGNGNDASPAGNNLTFSPNGCDTYSAAGGVVPDMAEAWTPSGACRASTAHQMSFGSGNFSVDVWIKTGASGNPWPILASCSGAQSACLELYLAPSGASLEPAFTFGGAGNGVSCTNAVNDGKWHHLAFAYNNPTQEIFVDGIPCPGVNSATMTVTASTIYVGGNGSGYGNTNGYYASGSIDSLRVYNQVFSDGTYGLHARGNIYRINGAQAYDGVYSDTFYPDEAAQSQPLSSWTWKMPTSNARLFSSTAATTVEFADEDRGENIGYQDYTVNVNQTQLPTPAPASSHPASDPEHSLIWNAGSYVCDTTNTSYVLTFSTGGQANGAGPLSQTFTGLTPDTKYGLQLLAAYADNGGTGATVLSSQSSQVFSWTYANIPGTPIIAQTGGTSASVVLSTDAGAAPSGPNNAGAANPAGTEIDVEYSANGGSTSSQALGYNPSNSGKLSIAGLPGSSKLVFASRAANGAGVATTTSSWTTALFVTQPNAPSGFSGAPSTTAGACGKTTIHWSWNAVTQGSNGGAADYVMSRSGGGSVNAACAGVLTATGCDESGFTPGQQVTDVVQASDTAVGLPFPLSSQVSATAQTSAASNGPVTFASGTATSGGIYWSWTAPASLCAPWDYSIHSATSGALLATLGGSPGPSWTQTGLGANGLSEIVLQAQDAYDPVGAVSSTVTAYSQAAAPADMTTVSVSSGSLIVSWSANGNPSYTRYEFSTSPNGSTYTVVEPISANFTSTSMNLGGLSPGATYYFQVRAINGSGTIGDGTAYTGYLSGAFMTSSTAPTLGTPVPDALNPTTQIDWTWSTSAGVSRYDLVTATTGFVIGSVFPPYSGTAEFTQTLSGPDSSATDEVIAYNGQGVPSASQAMTFFTDGDAPAASGGGALVAASSSSLTFQWSGNGNPAGAIYQVTVSTDPSFSIVLATASAAAASATVSGLFPSTTYYAQVRSVSGSGYASASLSLGSAATGADSQVLVSTSPASVYAAGAGVVGLWHFDESTGTTALDSSGFGNSGALLCAPGPCVSTPTYAAGRPGLGTALDFSGLVGGIAQIPDAPQYDGFTGSITISAWVRPASASMSDNAGIAVKGSQGSEDWFLEVVSGRYEFGVAAAGGRSTVLSNATVSPGQWTSLIGVFDASLGQLRLYVNGALDNSASSVSAPRAVSGHVISIGASQAAAGGPYNQTFQGEIDEVQVAQAAFSSQQAQAYYQSAFSSTVTVSGARGVFVSLPPNAFGAPAVIYTSDDPINHPLTANPQTLATGLLNLPTGQVLVPNSLIEIVPVVNGQPYTALLGSSATIGLPFTASAGVISGMSPPVAASSLTVYTFDPVVSRWSALPTIVDQQGGVATAQTPHFSVFALLGASTIEAEGADSARAYPDPWKRGSGGRFDAASLTFDQLPETGVIRILTLTGQEVIELPFTGADSGQVQWNGANAAGRAVASGVYFAYVKPSSGSSKIIKFAIEK